MAYSYGESHGYALGFDTSYTYTIFTASLNLKTNHEPAAGRWLYGGQAEFTAWLGANIGGGVGYLWGTESGPVYHGFLGLPLGDDFLPKFMEPFNTGYIEPYVRANFFFPESGQRLYWETGLMLKISTYTL